MHTPNPSGSQKGASTPSTHLVSLKDTSSISSGKTAKLSEVKLTSKAKGNREPFGSIDTNRNRQTIDKKSSFISSIDFSDDEELLSEPGDPLLRGIWKAEIDETAVRPKDKLAANSGRLSSGNPPLDTRERQRQTRVSKEVSNLGWLDSESSDDEYLTFGSKRKPRDIGIRDTPPFKTTEKSRLNKLHAQTTSANLNLQRIGSLSSKKSHAPQPLASLPGESLRSQCDPEPSQSTHFEGDLEYVQGTGKKISTQSSGTDSSTEKAKESTQSIPTSRPDVAMLKTDMLSFLKECRFE